MSSPPIENFLATVLILSRGNQCYAALSMLME